MGKGQKKNLLKTNYLNGEREEMLEKNKQNPNQSSPTLEPHNQSGIGSSTVRQ